LSLKKIKTGIEEKKVTGKVKTFRINIQACRNVTLYHLVFPDVSEELAPSVFRGYNLRR
jgi:hypothetical protein